MPLFNSYYKNNYEQMLTYYPRYYREVKEMDAILRTEGELVDGIQSGVEKVLNNCFIDSMDEETTEKFEEYTEITSQEQRTLQERKANLKSFLAGQGKTSASRIIGAIKAYTSGEVSCRFEPFDDVGNNALFIEIERITEEALNIDDIYNLLVEMLPAHIEYRPYMVYNYGIGIKVEQSKNYNYAYRLCGTMYSGGGL